MPRATVTPRSAISLSACSAELGTAAARLSFASPKTPQRRVAATADLFDSKQTSKRGRFYAFVAMSMRQTVPSPANAILRVPRRDEPSGDPSASYAEVFPVAAASPHGFYWKWRSVDGTAKSSREYLYFYDCLENARAAGYLVDFSRLKGDRSSHS